MATLEYSFTKNNGYGAAAGASDPYFDFDTVSYSGVVGESTVTSITGCKLTNANTNGASSSGVYTMYIEIQLNGQWREIGYFTTTTRTGSHTSWSGFTPTANAETKSMMGKYAPTDARGKVTVGYWHLNGGATLTVTATMEIDYTNGTAALDKSAVNAGESIKVTITQSRNDVTHDVVWSFGNHISSDTLNTSQRTSTLTPPLSWLDAIPNSARGAASCVIRAYQNGNLRQTITLSFYIDAPPGVVPSIGSFTATRIDNNVPAEWGQYIAGHSAAQLEIKDAAGIYGSTIQSYSITGGDFSTSERTLRAGPFGNSGNIVFTARVTDTRGRSATATVTITVQPYEAPQITGANIYRSDEKGNQSPAGVYGTFIFNFSVYMPSAYANSYETRLEYRERGAATWYILTTGLTSGAPVVLGTFDYTKTYELRLTLYDRLSTVYAFATLPTAMFTLHLRAGGTGAAFGKFAEIDKALEVVESWDFYVYGKRLADYIWPVGSVYINASGVNPATLFGGTWTSTGQNQWQRTA